MPVAGGATLASSTLDRNISSFLSSCCRWRNFGFYLPDSEFLSDPEGLIKYLVGGGWVVGGSVVLDGCVGG